MGEATGMVIPRPDEMEDPSLNQMENAIVVAQQKWASEFPKNIFDVEPSALASEAFAAGWREAIKSRPEPCIPSHESIRGTLEE